MTDRLTFRDDLSGGAGQDWADYSIESFNDDVVQYGLYGDPITAADLLGAVRDAAAMVEELERRTA